METLFSKKGTGLILDETPYTFLVLVDGKPKRIKKRWLGAYIVKYNHNQHIYTA